MSFALVAGLAIVGLAAPAHADIMVTYSTSGIFTGGDQPGTAVYRDAANNIRIEFLDVASDTIRVPPASQVTLGTFDTTGTTATSLQGVSSGFELSIFQTSPTLGTTTFVGTLQGQLRFDNSQAFVQFDAPLTQSIGPVTYRIIEADNGTPGRANISPPTSNAGRSTVEAEVSAVPEPASILMASLAVPALLLYGRSRKLKATT